jgi:hypothetical protein
MPTTTDIGIGRALRKARERQGLSIEEAALGTRLRPEYLEAMEREAFGEIPGEVYARSFLRSYARFLGLNADKCLSIFERALGGSKPDLAPVDRAPAVAANADEQLPGVRRHFPWPLAGAIAVLVLIAAGAGGLFARSASAPIPARMESPADIKVLPRTVQVDLVALRDVKARVDIDGVSPPAFDGTLVEGEARSFQAQETLRLWLESGASVELRVNGAELGTPGDPTAPLEATYTRDHYREGRSSSP